MTSEPPWELMGDNHPHEVRTTHRQVYGDRGPGTRTDHDGGLSPSLHNRCGIGRMHRDRARQFAAGPGVTPAVVGNHATDPGELLGRGPQIDAVAPAG